MDIEKLKLHELEELQSDVEDLIRKRKYEVWKNTALPREKIIAMFTGFGYEVPKGTKIWRIRPHGDKQNGGYGMQVGVVEHSCHIDSSTFLVLLVIDANGIDKDVEMLSDNWLSDPFIV